MELFQERAGVQPPLVAPIDGRFRTAVIQPISTEPEDVGSAMQAYQAAIRQVMISPSSKKDGGVPDNLSAGAATAFERAASVGDHGAQWVTLVRRTSNTTDLDLVGAMDAGRETSARWAAGQLVGTEKRKGRSVVEFPSAQEMVVHERRLFGRQGRAADRSRRRPPGPAGRGVAGRRHLARLPRQPQGHRGQVQGRQRDASGPAGRDPPRPRRVEQGRDQRHAHRRGGQHRRAVRGRRERRAADRERRAGAGRGPVALGPDHEHDRPRPRAAPPGRGPRAVGEVGPRGAHAARRAADRGHPRGRRARVRPARRLCRDLRDPARVGRAGGRRPVARRPAVPDQDAHVHHRLGGAAGDRSRDRGHRRHRLPGRAELARRGAAGGDAGDPPRRCRGSCSRPPPPSSPAPRTRRS